MRHRPIRPSGLTFLCILLLAACPRQEGEEPEPCGNGVIDEGEACDGAELGQQDCESQGFSYGELSCDETCALVTDACVDDPCWDYPCEPYSAGPGAVIEDRFFMPANDAAHALNSDDDYFAFHDLFQRNEAHGGDLKGALVYVSAGWCSVCAIEAQYLNAVYEALRPQGVTLVAIINDDEYGRAATPEYAAGYAQRYGWTFPTVAGQVPLSFWAPGENAGAVPFHIFLDLRTMRMTGRFEGLGEAKLLRAAMQELADGPEWGPAGQRLYSFDCAPGSGSESEPNGMADTPEDASALPFSLTGTFCPPVVAEGILMDDDAIDLGVLQAGTVIEVTMRPTNGPQVFPFFTTMRLNSTATALEWEQYGPVVMASSDRTHLWIAEETGRHMLALYDGRLLSQLYYGPQTLVPEGHACCEGSPQHTYDLEVNQASLSATEPALTVGESRSDRLVSDGPRVYPIDVVAGTPYSVEMRSSNYELLDPYISVYDPQAAALIGYNDDADYGAGVRDARVSWTASSDGTVLVVASYFWAFYRAGAPSYTIEAN